uniref:Family with sequence similarity 237 member A n=1 Tax=Neogobius melanostomus TaxID=47308 RepID=A0A8C6WP72_9GOBI
LFLTLRGRSLFLPSSVDPLEVPRANPQCWDSSSALLLEMRSPRIADTVPAFWDLMVFLKASDNSRHTALYWDLAGLFWNLYLECVLSRSHGLGRRHVTTFGYYGNCLHSRRTEDVQSVSVSEYLGYLPGCLSTFHCLMF